MPRIICPRCNMVTSVMPHSVDYVHDCSKADTEVLRTEDILKIGTFEEFGSSGGKVTNFYLGAENKLQGTRAEIEGDDVEDFTPRGKIDSLHRQRTFFEYIDLEGK